MWIDTNDDEENQTAGNGTTNSLTPGTSIDNATDPSVGSGAGTAGQPTSSSTPATNASGPSGTTSNPSTLNPIQSNQPQQSFANIQDYLGANQQQGNDLGQQFTSNLTNEANQDESTINTAVAGATNDINAGTTNYNPTLVSEAQSNPTAVANNPGDLNSFLQQWNAAYTGPSSFETSNEYGSAAAAGTDASQAAAETADAGGQQQLLSSQFNDYGQGNQNLDQALLQNSSSEGTIQGAPAAFNSVNDYLTSQAAALDAQEQTDAANTAATQTQTQGAFANSLTNFQNNLNNEVTNAQTQAGSQLSQYQADLQSGDPAKISADLTASGVDPATASTIVGYLTSLNKDYTIPTIAGSYVANPNVDINAANVATPQEYANAAALQKLTGVDYTGVLNPANASEAGTGTLQNTAFKTGDLATYLQNNLKMQDQSLLANNTPTVPDLSTADAGTQLAQRYIDAFGRNGITGSSTNIPPQVASLISQIDNGQGVSFNGFGKPVTYSSPGAQTFMSTINNWLQQGK